METTKVSGLSLRLWITAQFPAQTRVWTGSSIPKDLQGALIPMTFTDEKNPYRNEEKMVCLLARVQENVPNNIRLIVKYQLELFALRNEPKYSFFFLEVARQISKIMTSAISFRFHWFRIHYKEVIIF